ncbi:glycosyltransferase family 2 protein [Alphaproteobacteria bacterium]|nr:glycosyltransferase family 2 protein [Alphaproteobacteria bacterium]
MLVILYNRPDLATILFELLKKIGIFERVYISIDGPRNDKDQNQVQRVRDISRAVDLGGEVYIHEFEENQGCKIGVRSAIDWFFSLEKEGIILEDDCHPTAAFFDFMEVMLQQYRQDTRIAQICGSNTIGSYNVGADYFFSNFGNIWGWGTWRRAWDNYDRDMTTFTTVPQIRKNLRSKIHFFFDGFFRMRNFDAAAQGKIDTWDYQWMYSRLAQNQVCVIPSVSLVNNVGVGEHATHTFQAAAPIDHVHIDKLRESINWSKPRGQQVMLPNYCFELAVAEYKRGWRGCGPLVMGKKLFFLIKRKLFS